MHYRVKFFVGGLYLYTEWFSFEEEARAVLRTMYYAGVSVLAVEDENYEVIR